jgi:hypothetical protein
MSADPQVHIRFESLGEPYHTVTILIHEDSPATIERQLDTLEHLTGRYGAHAFLGEPQTEPPRHTASSEGMGAAMDPWASPTRWPRVSAARTHPVCRAMSSPLQEIGGGS